MVRTSALIIVMTISVFMLYGGCNGDNVLTTDEAPPGAEAPAGQSPECEMCPCKFFDIPMTEDCWVDRTELPPRFLSSTQIQDNGIACSLVQNFLSSTYARVALTHPQPNSTRTFCSTTTSNRDICDGPPSREINLRGSGEIAACRTCLEEYATALNESGVSVSGGPLYLCESPQEHGLLKSIGNTATEQSRNNPYLLSIGERAEAISLMFKQRQIDTKETLENLKDIIEVTCPYNSSKG